MENPEITKIDLLKVACFEDKRQMIENNWRVGEKSIKMSDFILRARRLGVSSEEIDIVVYNYVPDIDQFDEALMRIEGDYWFTEAHNLYLKELGIEPRYSLIGKIRRWLGSKINA